MKSLFIISSVLLVIFILGLGYLWNLGMFIEIEMIEKEMGSYKVAYEDHVGDYAQIRSVMDGVYKTLLENDIETTVGFGIYYDDPTKVEREKLRSKGGAIIDPEDFEKLKLVETIKVLDWEKRECLVVEFPYKNPLSIVIGVLKVYPEVTKYMEENNWKEVPIIEIYDIEGGTISYVVEKR